MGIRFPLSGSIFSRSCTLILRFLLAFRLSLTSAKASLEESKTYGPTHSGAQDMYASEETTSSDQRCSSPPRPTPGSRRLPVRYMQSSTNVRICQRWGRTGPGLLQSLVSPPESAGRVRRSGDTPLSARGYRPLDPRLSACSSRLCNNPGADGRGPQQGLTLLQAPAFPLPDLLLLLMLRPGWDDYRVLIFNDLPPLLQ